MAALPVCPFIVCNNTPKTKTKKIKIMHLCVKQEKWNNYDELKH